MPPAVALAQSVGHLAAAGEAGPDRRGIFQFLQQTVLEMPHASIVIHGLIPPAVFGQQRLQSNFQT